MEERTMTSKDGLQFVIREGSYDKVIIDSEWRGYQKRITVNPGDVWMDIGAHIGAFSLRIAPMVKEVHSFEADPYNFEVFQKNIALNPQGNIHATHGAVVGSCKPGDVVSFYRNTGTNTGLHSLVTKRGRDKIEVPAFDVKTIIFEKKVNKIKMDIEGGEWDLFANFDGAVFNQVEQIIMEYHFSALRDVKHEKYEHILRVLKSYYSLVEHPVKPSLKQWTCLLFASR